jgi:hypothetical protein
MRIARQAGIVTATAATATLLAIGYAHAGTTTTTSTGGVLPLPSPTLTVPVTVPSLPLNVTSSPSSSPTSTASSTPQPSGPPSAAPTTKTTTPTHTTTRTLRALTSTVTATTATGRLPHASRLITPQTVGMPADPSFAALVIPDLARLLPASLLYTAGPTTAGLPPIVAPAGTAPTTPTPPRTTPFGPHLAAGTTPAKSDLPIVLTALFAIAAAILGGQRALTYISRM